MKRIKFWNPLGILKEVGELREEVKSLNLRISKYEKSKDSNSQYYLNENIASDQREKLKELDYNVKSAFPHDWLKAAESDFATERQLLSLAKKCSNLKYYGDSAKDSYFASEIANAISNNSSTTDEVMETLTKSHFSDVLFIVGMSKKSGEKALSALAEKILQYYLINHEIPWSIKFALSNNPSASLRIKQMLQDLNY